MATAGTATVGTDGQIIYAGGGIGCTTFAVKVRKTSLYGAKVQVVGLHDADDWYYLEVGDCMVFQRGYQGIKSVTVAGDGGNAIINYGVTGKRDSVS